MQGAQPARLAPGPEVVGRLRSQADEQAAPASATSYPWRENPVRDEELQAGLDLHRRLHSWAYTAHELASDRHRRLTEIDPHAYTGQRPLPAEEWGVDGHDRYYDHVSVEGGLDGPGSTRVTFSGHWYPQRDLEAPDAFAEVAFAEISLPGWTLQPGGVDRYRAETDALVAAARAKEEAFRSRVRSFVDRSMNEQAAEAPPPAE